MGFGYMISLWGREGVFIPDCWEGFRRHADHYAKIDNPDDQTKPLFYFRKPIGDLIEDISEPEDRITVVCMDDLAVEFFDGLSKHKGRYIYAHSKEELEKVEE